MTRNAEARRTYNRQYQRSWYADPINKRLHIQRVKRAEKLRLAKYQEQINEIKSKPCLDCGQSYPPIAMDFDHRDPSKKLNNVSNMLRAGAGWNQIQREIDKCDVVCSNCHRVRTEQRRAA